MLVYGWYSFYTSGFKLDVSVHVQKEAWIPHVTIKMFILPILALNVLWRLLKLLQTPQSSHLLTFI